jgi:hypothetical protein
MSSERLDEVRRLSVADQAGDVDHGEWLVGEQFRGVAQTYGA